MFSFIHSFSCCFALFIDIYIYFCVCVYIYIYIYVCVLIYICIRVCVYIYICIYIYIYIYRYTHTHTHTHTWYDNKKKLVNEKNFYKKCSMLLKLSKYKTLKIFMNFRKSLLEVSCSMHNDICVCVCVCVCVGWFLWHINFCRLSNAKSILCK